MFIPPIYREPEGSWAVELVRRNPLAQLVSNGIDAEPPCVTHVPIIVDPHLPEEPRDLVGITLWGHMNRANPHWDALGSATQVVVTFTGPHAYVSPTVYATAPAAPTWNFTAVHARGVLRKVESADETLATVQATVRAFESEFGADWPMTESIDYFRRILPGVGAYRISVSHVDSMFKLSQEQSPHLQERVRKSFAQRNSTNHRDVAALMGRLPSADRDPADAWASGPQPRSRTH